MNRQKLKSAADPGSLTLVIDRYKEDVDRTLLRENLKLTFQQRFEKFESAMVLFDELRRAGSRAEQSSSNPP